jgi:hypothetical protein
VASDRFWSKDLTGNDKAGWQGTERLVPGRGTKAHILTDLPAPGAATTPAAAPPAQPAPPARPVKAERPKVECLVVLSETDQKTRTPLSNVVPDALELLKPISPRSFAEPVVKTATEAVGSVEAFLLAVRQLCKAEVVVFDVTHYEPAVMLLMGIRAVVRRGVTILSLGGPLSLDSIADLPFNIKDANLTSHAEGKEEDVQRLPSERLSRRIEMGLVQTGSLEYLDLPAYDAVRNLPATERQTIPKEECVLALVSFGRHYVDGNWKGALLPALTQNQKVLLLQNGGRDRRAQYGVVRSVDIDSPRLVSSAIYGFIRRAALCVVDWTDWRANVFFELGVRMAVGRGRTACLIDKAYLQTCRAVKGNEEKAAEFLRKKAPADANDQVERAVARLQATAGQCDKLVGLFGCHEYDAVPYNARKFQWVFEDGKDAEVITQCREAIREHLEVLAEPVSVPVHRELLQSALRFTADQSVAVSAVLYPENLALAGEARRAKRERLLASWDLLIRTYDEEAILTDERLTEDCEALIRHLTEDPPKDPQLGERLTKFATLIKRARQPGHPNT